MPVILSYDYTIYETICLTNDEINSLCDFFLGTSSVLNVRQCINPECSESEIICLSEEEKRKEKVKLKIHWLKSLNNEEILNYPSFNEDKSGYLLIEYTPYKYFLSNSISASLVNKRYLYFLNEEGRGLFDELNNIQEKEIVLEKEYFRYISCSVAIKINNDKFYSYLLNFEYLEGNLELINLKTGEISINNIFSLYPALKYSIGEKQNQLRF